MPLPTSKMKCCVVGGNQHLSTEYHKSDKCLWPIWRKKAQKVVLDVFHNFCASYIQLSYELN